MVSFVDSLPKELMSDQKVTFQKVKDMEENPTLQRKSSFTSSPANLRNRFKKCVEITQKLPSDGPVKLDPETKLKFYALKQQATEGPCRVPSPSLMNPVELSRWQAWKSLKEMSKSEAMNLYTKQLINLLSRFSDDPKIQAVLADVTQIDGFEVPSIPMRRQSLKQLDAEGDEEPMTENPLFSSRYLTAINKPTNSNNNNANNENEELSKSRSKVLDDSGKSSDSLNLGRANRASGDLGSTSSLSNSAATGRSSISGNGSTNQSLPFAFGTSSSASLPFPQVPSASNSSTNLASSSLMNLPSGSKIGLNEPVEKEKQEQKVVQASQNGTNDKDDEEEGTSLASITRGVEELENSLQLASERIKKIDTQLTKSNGGYRRF